MNVPAKYSQTVSIVIPYGGGLSWLEEQLTAISESAGHLRKRGQQLEIVVSCNKLSLIDEVDSALSRVDADLNGKRIDSSSIPGPSYARNAGAWASSGQIILFCDSDDIVRPAWASELAGSVKSGTIVGGPLCTDQINAASDGWWRAMDSPGSKWGQGQFVMSSNMAMSRRTFEQLGGFDINLTTNEDVDICWRAAHLGHAIAWSPTAVVDYRLRTGIRDQWRQGYAWGHGEAELLRKHRETVPNGTFARWVRTLASVIKLNIRAVTSRRYRSMAAHHTGRFVGRFFGSLRNRVWAT